MIPGREPTEGEMSDGGIELRRAFREVVLSHGMLNTARRPCGAKLSVPHAWALLELREVDGPMTVSELANRLSIDRTNVSRLCARMERLKELERTVDPTDRRATRLLLTAHGQRVAEHVNDRSAAHYGRLSEDLGAHAEAVISAFEQFATAAIRAKEGIEDEYTPQNRTEPSNHAKQLASQDRVGSPAPWSDRMRRTIDR